MRRIISAIAAAALAPSAGAAQPRPTEQKPAEAPKATPDTTSETFGDWTLVCGAPPPASGGAPGKRLCEVNATLTIHGQPGPAAKIAFARHADNQSTHVIALVPVNVSFHKGVRLDIDPGKSGLDLNYTACVPAACLAEAELNKDQLQTFRSPLQTGQISFEDATGQPQTLQFSYSGLDRALDAFFKRPDK